ncbi:MAG: NAD(P)H-dependent glycerol-3-phosphate dehydrogenase [Flaviflexus sp.]|uniref:NAD(P)H-dependent glycerol-3-phosphate dehydrogenase n=1 Tax=Flaviflexus sp. TaxID=1969482 RepID=UPI003F8E8887
MPSIAILGAGAMGSGLANALVRAGWEVNLWGTWLDDHLIDAIEAGSPHPRIDVVISGKVTTFRSDDLAKAMDGVDVVALSVASAGVPKVVELALPGISKAQALWMTTKGFLPAEDGTIQLLPAGVRAIAEEAGVELPPIVAIAGPVKANECAADEPTATIFGCKDKDVAVKYAREARSDNYAIEPSDDEVGVEVCAPMKNVYAIMLGIADGLQDKTGHPHHNLKAATFAQAVREMSILSVALGAKEATAYGLPGVGDLEVTGLSGRNKVYGSRIGRGEGAKTALETMKELEQTVEGVPAIPLAVNLVEQTDASLKERMPLLFAAQQIVHEDDPNYADVLAQAVLPPRP